MFNLLIFKKSNFFIFFIINKFFFIKFWSWSYNNKNVNILNGDATTTIHALFKIYTFYIRKLSFTGKAYKIIQLLGTINFSFNKANINYLFFNKFTKYKIISKQRLVFYFLLNKNILNFKYMISQIRSQNIFTARGLKLSQTLIFKKKGKVSSYTTQQSHF